MWNDFFASEYRSDWNWSTKIDQIMNVARAKVLLTVKCVQFMRMLAYRIFFPNKLHTISRAGELEKPNSDLGKPRGQKFENNAKHMICKTMSSWKWGRDGQKRNYRDICELITEFKTVQPDREHDRFSIFHSKAENSSLDPSIWWESESRITYESPKTNKAERKIRNHMA